MDYGFTHDGRVFTPNGTVGIEAAESDARNRAIEAAELDRWATRPETHGAYYDTRTGLVTSWLGATLGRITGSRLYGHNFGGRFIALSVTGSNGAQYYGRASYDNGSCVMLRKRKS